MEHTILETDRLILRPWRETDAEDLFAYAQDPDVGPNAGWPPHRNVEESRELSRKWEENWEKDGPDYDLGFALESKESGKVIGSLGLGNNDWRTDAPNAWCMVYALGKSYWGRGLMTEAVQAAIDYAFGPLGAKLLCITHYPDNLRSQRVIERCGFTYEGTLRGKSVRFDGAVKDLCCYSITAAEYWLLRAKKLGFSLELPENVPLEKIGTYQTEWGDSRMIPGALSAKKEGGNLERWLEGVIAHRYHIREPLATADTYLLMKDGEIIGALSLRHYLSENLLKTGGHIGYGIRPSQRGKGYAPCMLALGLEKAKERGIDRVLVTCDEDNPASARTIEACGGVLENREQGENGALVRRYWITV